MFLAGEGWQMGFESIDQPGWSSEVECNQKLSISFFWQGRGGRLGSNSLISQADHQKLNIIQKWAFHFFLSPLTSPASHQKLNIIKIWAFNFFGWRGMPDGVWVHWPARLIISSEHNPKTSISFYWLERGGGWGLSPLTSLANIRSWM